MAEVGLTASLLGIASFGIRLTTTLYKFGSTTYSARDQTDYVARHITMYADVLELLAQRIDDDEPIHSRKALDLVDEIYDHSCDLFDKVRDLLPSRANEITFIQKLKWNFRKYKCDVVVTEIEYLKSTVNLLVSVLYAGKKFRSYKRNRDSKKAKKDANIQFARVRTAIVEHVNATAAKERLQAKVDPDKEETCSTASGETTRRSGQDSSLSLVKHLPNIPQAISISAIIRFTESLEQAQTPSEERSLVIQNSVNLVKDLLDQWTTVAQDFSSPEMFDAEPSSPTPLGLLCWKQNDEIQEQELLPRNTASPGSEAARRNTVLSEKYIESRDKRLKLRKEMADLKLQAAAAKKLNAVPLPKKQPSNNVGLTSCLTSRTSKSKDVSLQGTDVERHTSTSLPSDQIIDLESKEGDGEGIRQARNIIKKNAETIEVRNNRDLEPDSVEQPHHRQGYNKAKDEADTPDPKLPRTPLAGTMETRVISMWGFDCKYEVSLSQQLTRLDFSLVNATTALNLDYDYGVIGSDLIIYRCLAEKEVSLMMEITKIERMIRVETAIMEAEQMPEPDRDLEEIERHRTRLRKCYDKNPKLSASACTSELSSKAEGQGNAGKEP